MIAKEYIAPDFWEEHCVECGAPACYETCEKYQRGSGGLCKRFVNGIELYKSESGRECFSVHFLPWGKLELYWQGRLTSRRVVSALHSFFRYTSPLIRVLFSEIMVRRIWRRVSQIFGKVKGQPNIWLIRCFSSQPTVLLASVVNSNKEELLVQRIDVTEKITEYKINLPELNGKEFFRLSSIEGSSAPVYFDCCELVNFDNNKSHLHNGSDKPARYVKCVAWDLDNTLWSGILADVGEEGIKLNQQVVSIIKTLDKRGIVSTICSKNDCKNGLNALENLGLKEYFVFPRINWMPKSENLVSIAKEMNLGINSFAFVDDSFHERGEVSENLPCVRVFSEREIEGLLDFECFKPPVSNESSLRRQQYLLEMGRKKDEELFEGNHEDFLRRCNISLSCCAITDDVIERRCWELVNRTNQLTLAAHRYSNDEFKEFLKKYKTYAIKCRDKYGDYGVVGVIAFSEVGENIELKEFVMSCRVAKKMCEQSVLLYFADKFRSLRKKRFIATVVETGRNSALVESFEVMPFQKKYSNITNTLQFTLDLQQSSWADAFRNYVEIL